MRTIITEIDAYKFDELDEDTQDEIVDNLWDINVNYDWWSFDDFYLALTQDEIDKSNLTIKEIEYLSKHVLFDTELLAFDIERYNFVQIKIIVNDDNIFRKFLGISSELWENCYYQFNSSGRYGNTCIEITEDTCNEELTDKEMEILEDAEYNMNIKIQSVLSDLKSTYDYLTSRESIIETIQINEYEFTKEGRTI